MTGASYTSGESPWAARPRTYARPGAGYEPAQAALVAPPQPSRVHWTTVLFAVGMGVLASMLLLTVLGVPGRMGFDPNATPPRVKPSGRDPLALSKSMNANLGWIDRHSADTPTTYVGRIKSINRSEAAIGPTTQAVSKMGTSVSAIDTGLQSVTESTTALNRNMSAMSAVSTRSGRRMTALGGDIDFLSHAMGELATATTQLTVHMSSIERGAGRIATGGTATARGYTAKLNATLPQNVEAPTTVGAP